MVKVLITGGAGFIASSLAERLLATGKYDITLVDNLLTGFLHNVPVHPNCRFIPGDVNDLSALTPVFETPFDYVFHFAAVVGVKRTLENPLLVLNDINGIRNVLSLSTERHVKRVFFSSSSEVYGEPVELPQHEHTTPLNSRLPYAIVKNVGESFFRSYHKEYGLPFSIFRFFNTYGPKQSRDFVISKFINAALQHQPITIYGDGSQTRTFCYIDDNTECMQHILEENACQNDVINIGNDQEVTILQLANTIIRATNSRSKIEFLPPLKEGDMTRRQPDNTKMKQLLGRELLSLDRGIQNILDSDMTFLTT